MDLSIVIPLLNEEDSLGELTEWISRVCTGMDITYEILFIDDGSTDGSWNKIMTLKNEYPTVKGYKFRRNYGKSAALNTGFEKCSGGIVITMDADLQDNPDEIPALFNMIKYDGFDLVSGWKRKRQDPMGKRIPSKFFNWVTRRLSGIQLNDFNCGLKAYSGELVKNIEVYGEMHRYIPVLAKNEGYHKIGEKIVNHRPRKHGNTKFGPSRFLHGFLDLLTVWFISSFGKRPMHLFGSLGLIMLTTGFLFAGFLGYDKIFVNPGGRLITERPEFYISLVTMIIGSQFFSMGFIGELILKSINKSPQYVIQKQTNL